MESEITEMQIVRLTKGEASFCLTLSSEVTAEPGTALEQNWMGS